MFKALSAKFSTAKNPHYQNFKFPYSEDITPGNSVIAVWNGTKFVLTESKEPFPIVTDVKVDNFPTGLFIKEKDLGWEVGWNVGSRTFCDSQMVSYVQIGSGRAVVVNIATVFPVKAGVSLIFVVGMIAKFGGDFVILSAQLKRDHGIQGVTYAMAESFLQQEEIIQTAPEYTVPTAWINYVVKKWDANGYGQLKEIDQPADPDWSDEKQKLWKEFQDAVQEYNDLSEEAQKDVTPRVFEVIQGYMKRPKIKWAKMEEKAVVNPVFKPTTTKPKYSDDVTMTSLRIAILKGPRRVDGYVVE